MAAIVSDLPFSIHCQAAPVGPFVRFRSPRIVSLIMALGTFGFIIVLAAMGTRSAVRAH